MSQPTWGMNFRLDADRRVVPCTSREEFERAWDVDNRRVAFDVVRPGLHVSTVFLCIDRGFGGPPRFFETMVFRDGEGEEQERCATWDEAVAQHARVLAAVVAGEPHE